MPTIKQKKLAKAIIENMALDKPKNAGELLESVGYAKSVAGAKPGEIMEQKGVQEALEEYGFTENNAKMVVSEIMLDGEVDPNARLKATDQVFKVRGSYAAEKHVNVNVEVRGEARERSKLVIEQFLNGSH